MYIAGRLRTASMPPKTLMDVASYLCPAPLPPADSFSAMSRASPQTARSYDCKILNAWWYTGRRSRGRLDTYLAHWPLHPKFPGRRGEAFIFLSEEESSKSDWLFLPWREQENWSEFGSDSAVQEESRTRKFYRKTGIFTR